MRDERDKSFLVGAFLLIKVMAGKLFFKPYKLTNFFKKVVSDLEMPILYKENCLGLGYTLVALFTDYIFDLYKPELERIEGLALTQAADIARVKEGMFQDLVPIADDYVLYKDFAKVNRRSEWSHIIQSIRNFIARSLEAVKQHRHLTDAGLQVRAKEDLKEIIKIRTQ